MGFRGSGSQMTWALSERSENMVGEEVIRDMKCRVPDGSYMGDMIAVEEKKDMDTWTTHLMGE